VENSLHGFEPQGMLIEDYRSFRRGRVHRKGRLSVRFLRDF
jgi:hypothetical protein